MLNKKKSLILITTISICYTSIFDVNNIKQKLICLNKHFFSVPITTISFCYTGIFRIARASLNKMNKGGKMSADKEEKKRKLEMKLAKTTAVSIVCFVVSWAPYASIAMMGVFGKVCYNIYIYIYI